MGDAGVEEKTAETSLPVDGALPGDGSAPNEAGPPRDEKPSGDASSDASRPLVLVVDDNADLRALLKLQLAPVARVVEASDGREALALARRDVPDGVVCDVMMPGMDGPAFLDALRADEDLGSVPLLFLTAKGTRDDELAALERGADDYLVKPFPADVLRARVVRMVERHRDVATRYRARLGRRAPWHRKRRCRRADPAAPRTAAGAGGPPTVLPTRRPARERSANARGHGSADERSTPLSWSSEGSFVQRAEAVATPTCPSGRSAPTPSPTNEHVRGHAQPPPQAARGHGRGHVIRERRLAVRAANWWPGRGVKHTATPSVSTTPSTSAASSASATASPPASGHRVRTRPKTMAEFESIRTKDARLPP